MVVCQSIWAAIANYYRLGGLKQHTLTSHSSEGWESKITVLTSLVSGELVFRFAVSCSLAVTSRGREKDLDSLSLRARIPS